MQSPPSPCWCNNNNKYYYYWFAKLFPLYIFLTHDAWSPTLRTSVVDPPIILFLLLLHMQGVFLEDLFQNRANFPFMYHIIIHYCNILSNVLRIFYSGICSFSFWYIQYIESKKIHQFADPLVSQLHMHLSTFDMSFFKLLSSRQLTAELEVVSQSQCDEA